ncbi:hypothetical protein LTR86_005269 [Recurvomyces mirabilis]|nr:hypothetical protein LTR86_005269 [Recurvomyces mirabilis]
MASSTILKSLNEARNICLATPTTYPQVIPGVLPVIGHQQHLSLRRWGSDFLAETFASPVVSGEDKQKMSLLVMDTLKGYLDRKSVVGEEEDPAVIKSAVQCAASIYPYVFRQTLSSPNTAELWSKMASIKSIILRTMDDSAPGVRICGVKFISRVVLVQTPGLIADPRRPEQNEISLALLGRDHAVLQPSQLEAEASGLLDRLLGVLQDNSSEALVVTATLNSLSSLVHRRASIGNKILTTVLNFNPLTPAKAGLAAMGGKERVALRSMTRTTMSFLLNVLKRNPNHALAVRLQQRTEQLRRSLVEIFSDSGPGKRAAPDGPIDGLDNNKRMRLDNQMANGTASPQQHPQHQQQNMTPPPLPPGEVSYRQLFTLNPDPSAAGFHVEAIPLHTVNQLVLPLLGSIDPARLHAAVTAVQRRFLEYKQRPPHTALESARAVAGDEDEDYDPMAEVTMTGDRAQVINRLDQAPPQGQMQEGPIQPIVLEPGPPLSEQEKERYGKIAMTRVFSTLADLDREAKAKPGKKLDDAKGFNRLAAAGVGQDREGWIMLLTRLATRTTFSLDGDQDIKQENQDRSLVKNGKAYTIADGIRQTLLTYVMDDFRRRIDVAITWLNEEWFCDRLAYQHQNPSVETKPSMSAGDLPHYTQYVLSTLDTLITYLDTKDGKTLIRFLSEIPEIDGRVLDRVGKLADDPERIQMCSQALLYLIMLRKPARELAIEKAVELWRGNVDAKGAMGKILTRWRPDVLKEEQEEKGGEVKAEL